MTRRSRFLVLVPIVAAAGFAAFTIAAPAAPARWAVPPPKDNPLLTIQLSGSTKQTTSYDNPAYGTVEVDLTWDLAWTGRLSQLAVPYISPNNPPDFEVRDLEGTYTMSVPAPNESSSCADKFVPGPYQPLMATEDNGDINIQVISPLTLSHTLKYAQVVAVKTGARSCLIQSDGSQPNSRVGTPGLGSQPDITHVVYDLSKGSGEVYNREAHPTVHENGVLTHTDFTSSLTINGASCVKNRSGPGCEPQVIALSWARVTPVVRDLEGTNPQTFDQFHPGCTVTKVKLEEYVACPEQKAARLRPAKNWPILATGGLTAEFRNVWVFIPPAPFPSAGPRIVGTTSIDGKKLTFRSANAHRTDTPDWWRFDNVRADGVWPQKVLDLSGKRMLTIRWQIEVKKKSAGPFPAGTTAEPVFVTRLKSLSGFAPDLSLVFPAGRDANGAVTQKATIDGIWNSFRDPARHGLHRYELDPVNGTITTGKPLQFWPSGWTPLTMFAGVYHDPGCPKNVEGLLSVRVATCNGLADYMAAMLRLYGVDASQIPLDALQGFTLLRLAGAEYFIVGSWTFPRRTPTNATFYDKVYPYAIGFHYPPPANGGIGGTPAVDPGDEVAYGGATGQWNPTPPGMWQATQGVPLLGAGDHALTRINGGSEGGATYDPSYGTGPFKDVPDWMRKQIVGWARVVDENGRAVSTTGDCGVAFQTCYLIVHQGPT